MIIYEDLSKTAKKILAEGDFCNCAMCVRFLTKALVEIRLDQCQKDITISQTYERGDKWEFPKESNLVSPNTASEAMCLDYNYRNLVKKK